jgi:pimeloyl-ACP methyl ester carboxylesterase
MRPFELVIVSLLMVSAIWGLVNGIRGRSILLLLGFTLLAGFLHFRIEGAHWQMVPAYLGGAIFLALAVARKAPAPLMIAGVWAMLMLDLATVCFSAILPMFRLPQPTGQDIIGTRVIHLTDERRVDEHDGSRKRELMIQIWYPAAPSRNAYAPYRRREETTLLSSYQSVLPTHSRWNAPVLTNGIFPVLLFNPAWNGRRTQNTYLVEDLASHGYVVVGIDHPYNSEPVALPDGRVIHAVPAPDMDFTKNSLETIRIAAAKELAKQAADTIFVLNQLQSMNVDSESPFYRHLDTNNVGAFGHSFGGAVAAQVCHDDPRIRAALDLDGSLWGDVQQTGLSKPFMMITGDAAAPVPPEDRARLGNYQRVNAELDDSDNAMFRKFGGYRIFLHGSSHFSFTDKALFSPFKSFSDAGKLRPRRQFLIVRQYTLAFFEHTLRGKSSPLINDERGQFSEVAFQFVTPGQS